MQAFGQYGNTIYKFDKADRVLALDSDFLQELPGSVRYARDFASKRRVRKDSKEMNRLYAVEGSRTITGAMADHRHPARASEVEGIARAIAAKLGVSGMGGAEGTLPWIDALVKDLNDHKGKCVVVPGEYQPASVHLLAHQINQVLGNVGNTVVYTSPVHASPADKPPSFTSLL